MRFVIIFILGVDACFSKWFGKEETKSERSTTVALTTTTKPIRSRPLQRNNPSNQRGRSQTVNNDTQVWSI